ncbi:hypothetical protein AB0B89_27110 [Sphaerisporangium sp. NPDC049002]|uniref:hypothetical protein n=1 Tax=Sphaerisporangium sp. NPDC049002 TaxID=3155392 RepID=UPI0033F1BB1D
MDLDKHEARLPCCEFCHYCDAPLVRRHEHDHFPIPKAAGGTETVPACMNCHEMKDRMPFDQWNPTFAADGLMGLLGGLPTEMLTPTELVALVEDPKRVWPPSLPRCAAGLCEGSGRRRTGTSLRCPA